MAAISGYLSLSGEPPSNRRIRSSLAHMSSRGGTESDVFMSQKIGLGISFNKTHAQGKLIRTNDPVVCIAIDGLIFNAMELVREFCIRQQEGIDTLLHLYRLLGLDFISKLRGNYALAIWDETEDTLVLGRDSIGNKPLHYALTKSSVIFASDLRALRPLNDFRIDADFRAIDDFLSLTYVPPPRTLARGIREVGHGRYIVIRNGKIICERLYSTPPASTFKGGTENVWAEELEELLVSSVSRRMKVSNRTGFLLSGGVDTAAIVGVATVELRNKPKTFTLRFPDDPEVDESSDARWTADYFKTDHTQVDVTSSCINSLSEIAGITNSPPGNPSSLISFSLFRQIGSCIDTVLCGDGGNDLMGGHYRYNQVMAFAQDSASTSVRQLLVKHGRAIYHRLKGTRLEPLTHTAARLFFERVGKNISDENAVGMDRSCFDRIVNYYIDSDRFWRSEDKQLLYSADFAGHLQEEQTSRFLEELFDYHRGVSIYQQLPYVRLNSFIPYIAIPYVETTATGNQVQTLFPLLDEEIIDFMYRVPFEFVFGKSFRHLFKRAFAGRIVPAQLFKRPAKGFRVPVETWMHKSNWKEIICENLSDHAVKRRGWFSPLYVHTVLDRFYSGQSYRSEATLGNVTSLGLLIWSLVSLEVWARQNIDPR
jgi:asparagine synthase (glutamine-hydrolysing)